MVIEKISNEEMEIIDAYRKDYAFNENASSYMYERMAPIEDILSEWNSKKITLFKMLGNELILHKDIHYTKSFEELEDEVANFTNRYYGRVQRSGADFIDNFERFFGDETRFGSRFSWDYGYDEDKDRIRQNMYRLISDDCLINNKYDGDTVTIVNDAGKSYKVASGCKTSKALGKIASLLNLDGYEDFRICHSQVLNQKTLDGVMTISIHPLDYMTMSDNDSGWESCMNWQNNGCYRQGTVEMMNSPTVIVAYLTSHKDMSVPGFKDATWNNKKWRQLFICDKTAIVGVKSYPYCNNDLSKIVVDWLKELAGKNLGWTYEDEFIEYHSNRDVRIPCLCSEEDNDVTRFFDFPVGQMYSDFGAADYHAMYVSNNPEVYPENRDYITVPYSGRSECMICGNIYPDFDDESCLACVDCQSISTCSCCGETISSSDEGYYVDDEYICSYCYENDTLEDCLTGERHLTRNAIAIHFLPRLTEEENKILNENVGDHGDNLKKILYHRDMDTCVYRVSDIPEFKERYMTPNTTIYTDHWKEHIYVYAEDLNTCGQDAFLWRYDNLKDFKDSFDGEYPYFVNNFYEI